MSPEQKPPVTLRDIHETLEAYIKSDVAWKERAEPVIVMGLNLRGAWKFLGFLAGFVAALAAIAGGAKYLWIFFTDFHKSKS